MLAGMFAGRYSFVILFTVISGICLWEFLTMTLEQRRSRRDKIRKLLGLALGLLPGVVSMLYQLQLMQQDEQFIAISSMVFAPIVFSMFIYELYTGSRNPFANIAYMVLGMFYIGIPFALLYFIAFDDAHFYSKIVFGLLVLTWVNDTGAYLVGSQFGRTPLFPRISPRKTWEGTIGGISTTIVFGVLLSLFIAEIELINWVVLAMMVAMFGTLGDLVESMLKRSVGVKDSGSLLPGHGGLLDRFDAFIFVIPFAAAYLLYLRG
jgi:phosphatidate cytidylyltransferase